MMPDDWLNYRQQCIFKVVPMVALWGASPGSSEWPIWRIVYMPFLEIISLGLVFMWTLRLARAKARNPWIWCSAAVAQVFLTIAKGNGTWPLLSIAPMVALPFIKAPHAQAGPGTAGIPVPRCPRTQPPC